MLQLISSAMYIFKIELQFMQVFENVLVLRLLMKVIVKNLEAFVAK